MSGGLLLMLCAPGFTALLTATRAARPATDAAVRASTADSAAAARAHYRSALRYHAQGRLDSAVATAQLAAQAFPTQSAYLALVALLAARRSDGVTLVGALERLARMEAGRDVAVDSAVLRMARGSANGATARVLARLLDASAPLPRSTVLATLQDSVLFPEGMDIDEHTGTLYVASVRDGVIVERRADGQERRILLNTPHRVGAALAVRLDASRTHLWVTTSGLPQASGWTPPDSALSALLRVRIADGVVDRRFAFPVGPGGHTLGDVAVAANGDVYVSDANHPVLYRLRRDGGSLETFRDPLFRSLQGIAPTPDGRFVYVADYSHGLLRLHPETGTVLRVADAAGSSALGCDGIALSGQHLIAVQNGVFPARIAQFTLDDSGTRITEVRTLDRNSEYADDPTTGVIAGDAFVYVANSAWSKYDGRGQRVPGTVLRRPVVLRLPLTPVAGR